MYTIHFVEQALLALVIAHYLRHIRKGIAETYHYTQTKIAGCKGSRFCMLKQMVAIGSFCGIMMIELSPILFYALHFMKS